MNRGAQALVVMLLGGAVLRATWTDVYLRYVKQGLRPFLIAAGLLLVTTAVMTLIYELRDMHRPADHPDDDDHGHAHGGPVVGWLLLLPAFGLLMIVPPALGADTAARAGSALTSIEDTAYPPLPPGDPAKLTLLEYGYRAVYDSGRTLRDREIQLTGFIATGPDGQPMLARIILACCAADGVPIKIGLRGDVPRLASDTWVQVQGRWIPHTAKDPVNDSDIPYLEVDIWQKISPPAEQYE
ncbi:MULTISPECIES: TIGR03943 family putative permease subunit [Micromonospora]|uniref:TIGR03943 family protein n=1 Tax=Micromonospora sicca TaxID=2202420 RepID=A0A317DGD4_9ACTN|nr:MULTISPECIES: TIGR03943 family protein [unclassified Micromonospora]MBM0224441.1 TIGR03943 family protein [Micromonospora sp. ATA51]PWR13514.1 TIGR03943 family protein [Micromonospora sp. 4G51]